MIGRLLVGLLKGIVIGGLVGFGLVKAGFVAPGALIAYLAAAVTGVVVGLVAGKPIWAKDAKIEAGMKAAVGAAIAAGLMFAVRRWLGYPIPMELPAGLGEAGGTFGSLSITSIPIVAALLAGFYDADNDAPPEDAKGTKRIEASGPPQRVAAPADEEDEELAASEKKAKR
jgi:hypothetical protein